MKPMKRSIGQRFRIGEDVLITILSANDEIGEVSFGIQAPRAIRIHKAERYFIEKIAENDRRYKKERTILLQEIEMLEEKIAHLKVSNHELYPTDIKIKRKFSLLNAAEVSQRAIQVLPTAGNFDEKIINKEKEPESC